MSHAGFYVLIPCYNHGSTLEGVIRKIASQAERATRSTPIPILIVDDGSERETQSSIESLTQCFDYVHSLRLASNQGKGAAVLAGLRWGQVKGLSHAIQIDADGQHDIERLNDLIEASEQEPDVLVSGRPIYDETVPKARLWGRYITHFWVWVETWSLSIRDSMCGFRVYPVEKTLEVARAGRFIGLGEVGLGMDFDVDIMVRFYWAGGRIAFIPTRVVYPVGGISHFDVWRDNVRISWMHTRLVWASLFAMPKRLWQQSRQRLARAQHWSAMPERRTFFGLLGFELLYGVYRLAGRRGFNALLSVVMTFYWLTGTQARRAAQAFLARVRDIQVLSGTPSQSVGSFQLFHRFGSSILDRLLAWRGELTLGKEVRFADEETRRVLSPSAPGERGKLILVSHLGVAEVCRAIALQDRHQIVHVLMFEAHAQQFKAMMNKWAPASQCSIIAVEGLGPDTLEQLSAAVERGEWVAIAADRIPVAQAGESSETTTVTVPFMGKPARFPIGPYVLAQLLNVPVVSLFAVRVGSEIRIHAQCFAEKIARLTGLRGQSRRETRQRHYYAWAQRYACELEKMALRYPDNWFNFYDFWASDTASDSPESSAKDAHDA